jgi:hypothetical protein
MRLRFILAAALLVLAACSDDGGGDAADDTEAPEATEADDIGGIEGITSTIEADAASAPPIDLEASAYETSQGTYTCG